MALVVLVLPSAELTDEMRGILDTQRVQAASYLQNAVLHRRVHELAALDDLTRILNRRFGLRRLNEEFSRAVRHGVPVSVAMVDVDHFKRFNDTYGHDAGDEVLRMVASTIEGNLRSGDVFCRYGGEEFLLLAPGTGIHDIGVLAERLCRVVESTELKWGNQVLSVTMSLGLATWPVVRASSPEELVAAADKALYHAKDTGRNRVAVNTGDRLQTLAELLKGSQSTAAQDAVSDPVSRSLSATGAIDSGGTGQASIAAGVGG